MLPFKTSPLGFNKKEVKIRSFVHIKIIKILFLVIFGTTTIFALLIAWVLYPHKKRQPLPPQLISNTSIEGQQLLRDSVNKADYEIIFKNFEPQIFSSFCGIASSVIVLNSLGNDFTQTNIFVSHTKSNPNTLDFSNVLFSGMTLGELNQYLLSKGASTSIQYANQLNLDEFRAEVIKNLRNPNDYMIINYYRDELGQGKVGHISPIAAYESKSDKVLILDTASHRYPHTWVPIDQLFKAMKVVDSTSEKSRGVLEVSLPSNAKGTL